MNQSKLTGLHSCIQIQHSSLYQQLVHGVIQIIFGFIPIKTIELDCTYLMLSELKGTFYYCHLYYTHYGIWMGLK